MSGLVGYGSSDEEDDELQPEKPAKMARLDDDAQLQATNDAMGGKTPHRSHSAHPPAYRPAKTNPFQHKRQSPPKTKSRNHPLPPTHLPEKHLPSQTSPH
ncbi:hypothetical protein KC367_g8538 [Hortaea werneckii]|nr:hypothetical protein KC367_g8538 [Hortaea werneckii]